MNNDEVSARLAEALAGFFHIEPGPLDYRAAAALLPVVRDLAAAELDAAANADLPPDQSMRSLLRARAAALRAVERKSYE